MGGGGWEGDQAPPSHSGARESAHLCPERLPGLHPSPPPEDPQTHTQMHMHTCTQEHPCIHRHPCTRTHMYTDILRYTACTHTDTPAHTAMCAYLPAPRLADSLTEGIGSHTRFRETGISDAPQCPQDDAGHMSRVGPRQAGWGCAQVLGFQKSSQLRGLRFSNINLSRASTPDSLEGNSVVTQGLVSPLCCGGPGIQASGERGPGGRRWVVWTGGSWAAAMSPSDSDPPSE